MSGADEHLSDLTLDRLLAGEEEGLEAARAHLEVCELCQRALEQRRAERAEWRAQVDKDAFVQSVMAAAAAAEAAPAPSAAEAPAAEVIPGRFGARRAIPVLVAALAAGLVGLVLTRQPGPGPGLDTVGLKGEAQLTVLVVEGDRSRPLGADERLDRGARIGLQASCPKGCQVYLHDADDFAPLAEGFSVPAGEPTTLAFTATLDGATRDERLATLACRGSVSAAARRARLAEGGAPPDCVRRIVRIPRVGSASE